MEWKRGWGRVFKPKKKVHGCLDFCAHAFVCVCVCVCVNACVCVCATVLGDLIEKNMQAEETQKQSMYMSAPAVVLLPCVR